MEEINIIIEEVVEDITISIQEPARTSDLINDGADGVHPFITSGGGGGSQNLSDTLVIGNNTDGNDILLNNADALLLENTSSLKKGTYDFGANGGVSRICGVGYEDMWQSGIRHVFDSNGFIRNSTNCFNVIPDNSFDETLRFKVGSIWTLDDGTNYICTKALTGVADWVIYNVIPTNTSDLTNDSNFIVDAAYVHTDNNFTTTLKTKLDGIAAGAEVNVNADWNATSGDAQILNKPTIPSLTGVELTANKQNSLTVDGTGVKYPTVDAVNTGLVNVNTDAVDKVSVKLGVAITKGQAVYVSSATGTNMIVSKASNITEATSSKTLGLLETTGVLNDFSKVITLGLFSGLNTSTATIGDPVWLGVNGDLIYGLSNKPSAPAHLVSIGIVTRVSATVGEIFVKVQNGFELYEIHDVAIASVADKQLLSYDNATSLWKNKSVTTADIADSTGKRYVTDANLTTIGNQSGTNTGDETATTIKTKLGITTLSGSNTGDQDLSGYVPTTRTVNAKALSTNVVLTTADIADSTGKRYQTENQNTFNDATSSIQTQINSKLNTASPSYTGLMTGIGATQVGTSVGIIDLSQTWNSATSQPTAIKLNVTDTQSNATSKLLDIQKDASSLISVYKTVNRFNTPIYVGGVATSDSQVASFATQGGISSSGGGLVREFYTGKGFITTGTSTLGLHGFEFNTTINQSVGSTGITRGLYINPTLTNAVDFRAIEVAAGKLVFSATNTATGTTGAQTINKISGKVNAAAATTSLVVTNSLVTTASIVMCQLGTNDATCVIKSVVEANGSFTINYTAPTAETVIKFKVIN